MPRLLCPATLTVLVVLLAAPVIAEDGTWSPLKPPFGRFDAGAVYDPVGDRLVIFGGIVGGAYGNDVWARGLTAGSEWEWISVANPPQARSGHTLIYDPVRLRLMLFGGQNYDTGTVYLNDVWVTNLSGAPAWTQLSPTGTPPPGREQHVAVYDPSGDRMIVFGGTNATSPELNDAWALSLSGTPAWQDIHVNGAPSRKCASAICDPSGARMLVFGGSVGSTLMNDVWELTLSQPIKWSALAVSGTSPAARENHTAVYDPTLHRMLVYGGTGPYPTFFGDVWSLSLSGSPSWTPLSPSGSLPHTRSRHNAVWDSTRNQMVIFSGLNTGYQADVWTLGPGGWTELPAPTTPGQRTVGASFYDPVRDRLVVFGGNIFVGSNAQRLNDVWVRSRSAANDWQQIFPSGTPPAPRTNATFIYDPSRDRAVLFGGSGQNSALNDVWALNLAQGPEWVQLQPVGTPPSARSRYSAIYDAERDRMVIFGGGQTDYIFVQNDTWELLFTDPPQWNELHPAGTLPERRVGHSAVLDAARDRMIVFGGGHGPEVETFFNDVWELSLAGAPAWNRIIPVGAPPSARTDHTAFFDPSRDRMVIHAGGRLIGMFPGTERDTWELRLSGTPAWNELHPQSPIPPPRGYHAWGYDSLHDVLLVFGGYNSSSYRDDTWVLGWNATTGVVDPSPHPHIALVASPNPILSRTTFQFDLKQEEPVDLTIHDLQGRRVATVLDHRVMPAGVHEVSWTASRALTTSGLYVYRLRTASSEAAGRLVFLK